MNRDIQINTVRLLRECKGASLHVLVALVICVKPVGISFLSKMLCLSRETVQGALENLAAVGYAENLGGHNGWLLTSDARQLPLFTLPLLVEMSENPTFGEVSARPALCKMLENPTNEMSENPTFGPSSSSLINVKGEGFKTTTTDSEMSENPTFGPEDEDDPATALTGLLCSRTTCPPEFARAAVAGALGFWDAGQVRAEILAWLTWCGGRPGINNPGAYVASRIRVGRSVPAGESPAAEADTYEARKRKYVPAGYEDLIEH